MHWLISRAEGHVGVCLCVCVCVCVCVRARALGMRVGPLLPRMLCRCLLFASLPPFLCLQWLGSPVHQRPKWQLLPVMRLCSSVIEPCQHCPLRPRVCASSLIQSPFLPLRHFPFISWHRFKSWSPYCACGGSGMESNWCYCTVLRRNAFNERHVHICKLRSLCHDCILLGFLDRLFAVRGFFCGFRSSISDSHSSWGLYD